MIRFSLRQPRRQANRGEAPSAARGDAAATAVGATGPARRHALPETMVVQVTGTDPDGDALARPVELGRGRRPAAADLHAAGAARPRRAGTGRTRARAAQAGRRRPLRGPHHAAPHRGAQPHPRRVPRRPAARTGWSPPTAAPRRNGSYRPAQDGGAAPGEIVLAEPLPHHQRYGLKPARVIERLGTMGDARSVSLIAIHTHDIPVEFPPPALEEARARRRHVARPPHRPARHPAGDDRRRGRARLRRRGVRRADDSLATAASA